MKVILENHQAINSVDNKTKVAVKTVDGPPMQRVSSDRGNVFELPTKAAQNSKSEPNAEEVPKKGFFRRILDRILPKHDDDTIDWAQTALVSGTYLVEASLIGLFIAKVGFLPFATAAAGALGITVAGIVAFQVLASFMNLP